MHRYLNLAGDSGVAAYAIAPASIRVKFSGSDRVYVYSHASAGQAHVEERKRLAQAGRGLSTYLSQHVADAYVR